MTTLSFLIIMTQKVIEKVIGPVCHLQALGPAEGRRCLLNFEAVLSQAAEVADLVFVKIGFGLLCHRMVN